MTDQTVISPTLQGTYEGLDTMKAAVFRGHELVRNGRLDLTPLITHRFSLGEIEAAYELFGNQRDGVVKVAIDPSAD